MNPGRREGRCRPLLCATLAGAVLLSMMGVPAAAISAGDSPTEPKLVPVQDPPPVTTPEPAKTPIKKPTRKKSSKKKKPPDFSISGTVALRFVYDDNFIHYSDDDLNQFSTEPNFGKFSVASSDDLIVRPRLDVTLKSRQLTGKTMEIRLRFSSWKYRDNGVKNNESYSLRLKHPGFGRDNFQLSFYHAPMTYLRTFLDRPPYTPRSTPSEYTAFSYASNTGSLGYWKRWSKSVNTKLNLGRSIRYYNRPFMENDNWEWKFGGYVSWRFYKRLTARMEYFYSDVRARAADTEGEDVEFSDDGDASYERDSYKLGLSLSPRGGFFKVGSVSLSGQYQAYYFTSEKAYFDDPYHVGRKDQVYRAEITARSVKLLNSIKLESGYRFTERTSSAAFDTGNSSIGEDKDYTDNRFWLGVEYPF